MKLRLLLVASAAAFALGLASSGAAFGQTKYPSKNIEVVVPYAPGGGTDNMMRMITAIMEENKWAPVPLNVINASVHERGDMVRGAITYRFNWTLLGLLFGTDRL